MPRATRPATLRLLVAISLFVTATSPSLSEGQTCSPTIFQATPHLVSTSGTELVATADFNGDTHQDLVTTSRFSAQIGILLGNGAGAFSPQPSLAANFPHWLEAFDVDTDGDVDIVALGPGEIRVYRGNGNGSFQAPLISPTGSFQFGSLVLGFFDADAEPDAVLLDFEPGTLRFLEGAGDGTFTLGPTLALPSPAAGMVSALFDGDTEIDLAVSHPSGAISIFRGNGDGTFAAPTSIVLGFGVGPPLAADLTGDGDTDVAVAVGAYLSVLEGLGTGTFLAAIQTPVVFGVDRLNAADIDGDGLLDVLATSFSSAPSPVFLFRGTGQARLGDPVGYVLPAGGGGTLLSADFIEDGRPDVVAGAGGGTNDFSLLRNDGGRFATPEVQAGSRAGQALAAADFDGDGLVDVAISNGVDIAIELADVEGRLRPGTVLSAGEGGCCSAFTDSIVARDFNADGRPDIAAVVYIQSGRLRVFLNQGGLVFGPAVDYAVGEFPMRLEPGDLDEDGVLDLAIPLQGGNIFVARGVGDGTFVFGTLLGLGPSFGPLRIADVNGDTHLDLVTTTSFDLATLLGNGDLTFQAPIPSKFPLSINFLDVADVNGDTHLDLVAGTSIPNVAILLGDSTGVFSSPTYLPTSGGVNIVARDLDEDGHVDIAAPGPTTVVYRGLGGMLFEAAQVHRLPGSLQGAIAMDLGGDGKTDLVASALEGIEILRNALLGARVLPASAVCVGSVAELRAAAFGYGPLTFQWRKGGMPLSDGGAISGSTTPILTIDPAAAADSDDYDVVVTDSCTTVTSAPGTLTVVAAPTPPVVTVVGTVPASTPGLTASVPGQAAHAYTWTLTGGTITAGQGTSQVTFTSGTAGTTMQLSVEDAVANCAAASSTRAVQVQFADVAVSDPFSPFIHTIARNGVTAGCGGGNFCPDLLVTRAQMAVFLLVSKSGAAYVPPPATGLVFLDVPANAFAAAFIEALAAAQVTGGCGGGNYCPDFFATRAQMAIFLLRMLEGPLYNPPPATGTVFGDVGVSDFAAAYIEEIADRGITSGCGGGNYCPNGFVTRAQMAVFLTLTFELQ